MDIVFGDPTVDTICATCNHFFVLRYTDTVHAAVVGGLRDRPRLHQVRSGVTFHDLLASALPLDSHRDLNLRAERTTFFADIGGVDGLKVVFDDRAQVRGLQITMLLGRRMRVLVWHGACTTAEVIRSSNFIHYFNNSI